MRPPRNPVRFNQPGRLVGGHPTQQDQVPSWLAEVEVPVERDRGRDARSHLPGPLLSQRHGLIGGIESGDRPPELCQVECVTPLAHTDIERAAGLPALHHRDQELVWCRVESWGIDCEEAIPEVGFEIRPPGANQRRPAPDLGLGHLLREQALPVALEERIERLPLIGRQGGEPSSEFRVEVEVLDLGLESNSEEKIAENRNSHPGRVSPSGYARWCGELSQPATIRRRPYLGLRSRMKTCISQSAG